MASALLPLPAAAGLGSPHTEAEAQAASSSSCTKRSFSPVHTSRSLAQWQGRQTGLLGEAACAQKQQLHLQLHLYRPPSYGPHQVAAMLCTVASTSSNSSSHQRSAGHIPLGRVLRKIALVAAGITLGNAGRLLRTIAFIGGGGGFGGFLGGGGGGGGGRGGFNFDGAGAALAMTNEGEAVGESFLCEEVRAKNLITGPGVPTQEELFEQLQCQPGKICTRADVNSDLNTLLSTGLFQKVDVDVEPTGTGYVVIFSFREKVWTGMKSFQVAGSTKLPQSVCDAVLREAKKSKWTTVRVLAQAKTMIEEWYQDRGYVFGTVSSFDGMETGKVTAQITEGEISKVDLLFIDNAGRTSPTGQTKSHVIRRELPFRIGQLYNIEDGKKALRDIFLLQLFDNVQVVPRPDNDDPTKVAVDIMLKERPMKTVEWDNEWPLQPNAKGWPEFATAVPGGTIFVEHRNLKGEGRQLYGSITTSNFLNPNDDLGFKVDYAHPYLRGSGDEDRTALRVSAFNSRKLSPVFIGGPGVEDVPSVWVDRVGVKGQLTQHYTRQSKGSAAIVLEEITTRDESGQICVQGTRPTATGQLAANGPPTTLSDTGSDKTVFLQGNLTRDNTVFENGSPVGSRDILQVEQGLSIGTGRPFFNRYVVTLTKFLKLTEPKRNSSSPPVVLVLFGRHGRTFGDLASYDAFTLGGPYSVRGYNVGEIAVCRQFLEAAVELRAPIPRMNTYGYAFYEHATDLGSSEEVRGNPTTFFRRPGKGSSWGAGVKLGGAIRAEYIVDNNSGEGAVHLRFGERF
eukprot:jgi/Chlat1/2818/Chrsp187S02966